MQFQPYYQQSYYHFNSWPTCNSSNDSLNWLFFWSCFFKQGFPFVFCLGMVGITCYWISHPKVLSQGVLSFYFKTSWTISSVDSKNPPTNPISVITSSSIFWLILLDSPYLNCPMKLQHFTYHIQIPIRQLERVIATL